MDTVFSDQQIEIYKAWLLGKKNKEIALALNVSESYISQTLKTINEKITTLENSIAIMREMGLIDIKPLTLTHEGKQYFLKRHNQQVSEKTKPVITNTPKVTSFKKSTSLKPISHVRHKRNSKVVTLFADLKSNFPNSYEDANILLVRTPPKIRMFNLKNKLYQVDIKEVLTYEALLEIKT